VEPFLDRFPEITGTVQFCALLESRLGGITVNETLKGYRYKITTFIYATGIDLLQRNIARAIAAIVDGIC
jgi:hypothetical protein